MATKLVPQIETTTRASRRWRNGRAADMAWRRGRAVGRVTLAEARAAARVSAGAADTVTRMGVGYTWIFGVKSAGERAGENRPEEVNANGVSPMGETLGVSFG